MLDSVMFFPLAQLQSQGIYSKYTLKLSIRRIKQTKKLFYSVCNLWNSFSQDVVMAFDLDVFKK